MSGWRSAGALDGCGPQTPTILDGNVETLHERARVFAEALLAGNQRIAVVCVLHGAFVGGHREKPTSWCGPSIRQVPSRFRKFSKCLDLLWGGLLLGDHMVETEDHQRVGVVENALVNREFLSCLVDALVDGDGMSGDLADEVLKAQQAEMKQFQRSRDSLEEHLL